MDVTVRELTDHSAPIFDWPVIIFTSPVATVSEGLAQCISMSFLFRNYGLTARTRWYVRKLSPTTTHRSTCPHIIVIQ